MNSKKLKTLGYEIVSVSALADLGLKDEAGCSYFTNEYEQAVRGTSKPVPIPSPGLDGELQHRQLVT